METTAADLAAEFVGTDRVFGTAEPEHAAGATTVEIRRADRQVCHASSAVTEGARWAASLPAEQGGRATDAIDAGPTVLAANLSLRRGADLRRRAADEIG